MPKLCILIGARGGSKRIIDKNIQILDGDPLFAWSITTAKHCRRVDDIFFSTDSAKYAEIAAGYYLNEENIIIRPACYATDTSPDYEWINHAILDIETRLKKTYTHVMLLRPMIPIRSHITLDKAIEEFYQLEELGVAIHSMRSIQLLNDPVEKLVYIHEERGRKYLIPARGGYNMDAANMPAQGYRPTYLPNGYFEIFRTDIIKDTKQLFGTIVHGFITEKVVEIDDMEDLEMVRRMVK